MSSCRIFNGFIFCSVFVEGLQLLLRLLLSSSGPSQPTPRRDKHLRDADHRLSGDVDYLNFSVFHSHFLAISCLDLIFRNEFI